MEFPTLIEKIHTNPILIGHPAEFMFRGTAYVVREYFNSTAKVRHTWTCTSKATGKVIWSGFCRSTAECIKIVKEILAR